MNDRILGFAALVFAALMVGFGWSIHAPFSYEPVGPRTFPMLIAAIVAICGVRLVVKGGNQAEKNPPGANLRIGLMTVYCALYAYFFQDLGFIIATILMTIAVGRLFSGPWWKITVGGIVMSLLFFVLFDRVLDVVLPPGILENWL